MRLDDSCQKKPGKQIPRGLKAGRKDKNQQTCTAQLKAAPLQQEIYLFAGAAIFFTIAMTSLRSLSFRLEE
jgi:hypothetical protein